ncbi:hypothetical protein I6G97_02695 [Edwardsiella hoshinae]|uniref:Uncharacterized protein n=1 Tax=Edwardsiella hoshinae TaxID=93378 RepID=A0A376D6N7_9GAMM|nr:hypothetical protein [Edwardsiella hoshinae]QPR29868.1 hypothetical protein I6G97_02695 [Edwardsiella hoshinae]STC82788.1 Uncharacterised protein [Edwardsiella hoshinae]
MAHERTLDEVVEMARQAEVIAFMLEACTQEQFNVDVEPVAALLRRLCGNVTAWLIEESVSGKEVRHG